MTVPYEKWAARYLFLRGLLLGEKWADLPGGLQDLRPDGAKYVSYTNLDEALDQALHEDNLVVTTRGLLPTHRPKACAQDDACCIHKPSAHPMRDWPLHWRSDTGVMERLCHHGVGHPDPDHLAYVRKHNATLADTQAIHGCCGCCRPTTTTT